MLKTMARAGSLVGNRCRVREVAWLDGFCGSSAALPTLRGFVVHILSAFQLHRFAQQRSARCRPAACLVCAVQNDTQASRTWHRLRKEPEPASATGSRRNPPPHFFVKKDSKIPPRIVSFLPAYYSNSYPVADGLFCREIDGLFCRSSPDIIVRRRCVLSHKRRGWLQPSPSFRYSRNLALQDELYHPVINNGPAVLVCVDKRLGTGPVNQSRDAG